MLQRHQGMNSLLACEKCSPPRSNFCGFLQAALPSAGPGPKPEEVEKAASSCLPMVVWLSHALTSVDSSAGNLEVGRAGSVPCDGSPCI